MFPLIQKFIDEYKELKEYLIADTQITMSTTVDNHFRKVFLLSCASYYEKEIQDAIKLFIEKKSFDERVLIFATNKGIERQYHTYFDWKGVNNINSFLGLFGSDFKNKVSGEIKLDNELEQNMKAFLIIGYERNKMVHENFLSYNLEKTFDEISMLNNRAIMFIEYLKSTFD